MITYLTSIKTALVIFPLIAFFITVPFIIHQYHKYGSIHTLRLLIIYSFILYLITAYFLVILPLPKKDSVKKPEREMIQLVPFHFIEDLKKESTFDLKNPKTYLKSLTESCVYTVVFNIIMTIPFGMYLRYYYKYNLKKTILMSFLLSLFFEVTQITGLYYIYPYPYRMFDVDDLITNTLGGIFGFYLMGLFAKFIKTRDEIDEESRQRGEIVSGLRRITIFGFDCFLYFFVIIITSIFLNRWNLLILSFFIYYSFIPLILDGKTIGSKFMNVKLEFPNFSWLRLTLRNIFLYLYYFGIPFVIIIFLWKIDKYFCSDFTIHFIFCILAICIIALYYLTNGLILIIKRRMFYDTWFDTNYQSTILEK